jgi:hypothetical protein
MNYSENATQCLSGGYKMHEVANQENVPISQNIHFKMLQVTMLL